MPARIIGLCTDLIFSTKIRSTAEAVGARVELVRTAADLEKAGAGGRIGLVLIDLHADGLDAGSAIAAARALPGPPNVVAFFSHVRTELAAAARAAGADEVLARSEFTARLANLLLTHSV